MRAALRATLRLLACTALLAGSAQAEPPASPQAVPPAAKEALRQELVAAFKALPTVHHALVGTLAESGREPRQLTIELWREGVAAGVLLFGGAPDEGAPVVLEAFTDGIALVGGELGTRTRHGDGVERLVQRRKPHQEAADAFLERWDVGMPLIVAPSIRFGVQLDGADDSLRLGASLAIVLDDGAPAWLAEERWAQAKVQLLPDEGLVVVRNGPVEARMRRADGVVVAWSGRHAGSGRHALLRASTPRIATADWRTKVRDACVPLHALVGQDDPFAWLEAVERKHRVEAATHPRFDALRSARVEADVADVLVAAEIGLQRLPNAPLATLPERLTAARKALLDAMREAAERRKWTESRTLHFLSVLVARWEKAEASLATPAPAPQDLDRPRTSLPDLSDKPPNLPGK